MARKFGADPAKAAKAFTRHHAAMAYSELPGFMARLRESNTVTALALEFLVLTAARSGEVRGACWSEIDLDAKVWSIPASRMKSGNPHREPLSGPAVAILARLGEARLSDFLFFGRRLANPISPMAMTKVLRRMNVKAATVHGFRSTFRDWCGNETNFPREIAEHALAHATGSAVELAYRRGDALEKRRALMDAWAAFCEPFSNVTP